jgi:hypothetical protein
VRILVDGDVVAFRAGFGAEHMEYDVVYYDEAFDEDVSIRCRYHKDAKAVVENLPEGIEAEIEKVHILEPLSHALHNVGTIMANILEQCGGTKRDLVTYLSGPSEDNFRMEVATIKPYKGNRNKAWRPTYEQEIKAHLVKNWKGEYTLGQEADDALGIAQSKEDWGESVIVTNDKDLDMIPGCHYNFVKDERYTITPDVAIQYFWYQMLVGDSTDNILGCPGIGEARAKKALKDVPPLKLEAAVWALYVQSYGWAAWPALKENARLLWIRRKEGEMVYG